MKVELPTEKKSTLAKLRKKFVVDPIKTQLTRGISKEKIALTMAISPVISAFPVMGTTNLLCIIAGSIFRLNIPFLMLFKSIFYPLHLGMILVFIRIGENMNNAPHIPFSIPQLLMKFKNNPLQFTKDFGITALYGIEAWAVIAPWFAFPLYFLFRYLLGKHMNLKPNKAA